MGSQRNREAAMEETELQMTPMIDVTFLLLIFFMCSIKFKLLDGKMQTYLPRDVGVNQTQMEIELEKIDIYLKRNKADRELGFDMAVNNRRINSLQELYTTVKGLHQRAPDLKTTIYPAEGVEYGHVVKVVNECLRADMTQITFGAAPTQ